MRPEPPSGERGPDRHWRRWGPPGAHGRTWRGRPGRLFFRFLFSFGLLALLFAALLSVPFLLFSRDLPGPPGMHVALRGLICVFSLLFVLFVAASARRLFLSIATPLGEVMEAADAVAGGDLTARVPETGGGIFRQLSRSFNHMAVELERSDEQRRRLTADVAHELRNPLHIIRGNLEGILDGVYTPDGTHIANTLDETRLLSRLVDDLQTLSLAEAGRLDLVFEPVELAELIADVRTSFSGQAENQGIDLVADLPESAGFLRIDGDHERLQQVLGNLVANALRYTSPGGTIRIGALPAADGAILTVEDTGAGIPAEDLPHIFDRFWKGDRSRTRLPGAGSGLGLAIAKQLVRAHGGTIEVRSAPGAGTRFTIRLPAGKEHE
jgi:signal transduction histidine kinase